MDDHPVRQFRLQTQIPQAGLLICLVLGIGWVQDDTEFPLVPKEFPKGWIFFSADEKAMVKDAWIVDDKQEPKEAVVVCLGKSDGYIRTEQEYENFELGLEWQFPSDENGNSGILLHTIEKDMLWPKAIQVQLHRPTVGTIIPHSGAKTENTLSGKNLSKPLGEWNTCVITCVKDKITVVINDTKVGEVTGCFPNKGAIGLQSEGSEVQFRNIWIKPLKSTDPPKEKDSDPKEPDSKEPDPKEPDPKEPSDNP